MSSRTTRTMKVCLGSGYVVFSVGVEGAARPEFHKFHEFDPELKHDLDCSIFGFCIVSIQC